MYPSGLTRYGTSVPEGIGGVWVVLEEFVPGMGPGNIIQFPLFGGQVADVDGSEFFK